MIDNNNVISAAKTLGFDIVGFAKADPLDIESANLSSWLEKGYHADMHYMEKNRDKRKNVKELLPDAKSVISLGLNYYTSHLFTGKKSSGKISRYAWGTDYHNIIWEKLYITYSAVKRN